MTKFLANDVKVSKQRFAEAELIVNGLINMLQSTLTDSFDIKFRQVVRHPSAKFKTSCAA